MRIRALTYTASLAALALAACAPATDEYGAFQADYGPSDIANAPPGVIDVTQGAPVSLALQGGLGPIVEGQTVNRAVVSIESIELVSAEGYAVPLLNQPATVDLLAVQNSLDELISGVPLPPGQFTHMRFRLGGAFIEVASFDGGVQFFATPGMDLSGYGLSGPPGQLALQGMQPGGFFDVAIPPDGIAIRSATSLAMQFDLAQSLQFQSGSWVLDPRVWVVDQSILSSLDVAFEAQQAAGFEEFAVQGGFEVMLFDAGMRPVATAPLALLPGGMPGASFQYLAPFQGPFVAVLLPPPGIELASAVSVSVAVQSSVHVETSIVINSFREVRRSGGVAIFDIGAANQASIIQRGPAGQIIGRATRPVGPIEAVMPRVRPHEPLLPGQTPGPIYREAPYLRGLPRPIHTRPGVRPGGPPRWGERGRPGIGRPGERGRFPGERPPISRPGERPGFPGQRPPGTRPGERPGFPGARPPVSRPGERPGFPGHRPPGARPGERPGFPGARPPVSRPGERPGFPSEGPSPILPGRRSPMPSEQPPVVTPPGRGRGSPGIRPPSGRPEIRRGSPGERPPSSQPQPRQRPTSAGEAPRRPPITLQEPEQGQRPPARRPGEYVGAPEMPPASRRLEAPTPVPESRPRVDPRRPTSERPPARTPTTRGERERENELNADMPDDPSTQAD